MGTRRVFVSHAHADNALCDRYVEALRARGFDVWYDRSDLQGGSQLSDEIQRELATRSAFLVMLTPESVESFWVGLETDAYRMLMPHDRTRLMLPVRIRPCDVPILLRGTMWIDAVDVPFDEAVDRIANALSSTPPAARTADAPPLLRRRVSRRTVLAGSAGLVAPGGSQWDRCPAGPHAAASGAVVSVHAPVGPVYLRARRPDTLCRQRRRRLDPLEARDKQ
jgi:hypothetical protein